MHFQTTFRWLTAYKIKYHSVAQQCLHCCKIDQPMLWRGGGVEGRTPKPLNRLTKNLVLVITSAMTSRMPKLKTNTPLGTWQHMREISPSRGF